MSADTPVKAERWREITEIFHAALEHDEVQRAAFVAEACAGDEELRLEVLTLLRNKDDTNGLFRTAGVSRPVDAIDSASTLVGTEIGSYHVRSLVGTGAMGAVYAAYDPRLQRIVAIKVLPHAFASDAERLQRFEREARAAAALSHPNIVAVHDVGQHDGRPYIVMEFVPGETLSAVMQRGRVPIARALVIGAEIADALAAAHASGVVHRDLKPANIMVMPNGRVKVLDFGLAKIRVREPAPFDPLSNDTILRTGPGVVMGTPGYMSPEQLLGRDADHRSDIFSLGVILFELATQRRPFEGRDVMTLALNVVTQAAPPAHVLEPTVPRRMSEVIARTLAVEPEARTGSAALLKTELDQIQRELNSTAPVPVPVRPKDRAVRWRAAIVLMVAAVAAAVLLTIGRYTDALRSAPSDSVVTGVTPIRVGVLPARNLSGRPELDSWGPLIQALFSNELTGIPGVGVLDPLSFNEQIGQVLKRAAVGEPLLKRVRQAGADVIADTSIVPIDRGAELRLSLIDVTTGQLRYSTQAPASRDDQLPVAIRSLASNLTKYVQLQLLRATGDKDMAPWISLRERNIDAVRAFAQANEFMYRLQLDDVLQLYARAIELDPTFIAPRIWEISGLLSRGRKGDAERRFAELVKLKGDADPFEQAMIGFAGALLNGSADSRIHYLGLALSYSPGNNILLVNLAQARAQSGDCAGALADLTEPVRMKWDYPPLYSLWGWCAIAEQRVEDARRVLKESLDRPRTDPTVYALLEALELAAGTPLEAKRYGDLAAAGFGNLGRDLDKGTLASAYDRLAHYCRERNALDRVNALSARAATLRKEG